MVVAVKQVDFDDRLKEFRAERIGLIIGGETRVKMEEGARAVLHIVPQRAFETTPDLDLLKIMQEGDYLWPIDSGNQSSTRYNFDGLLSFITEGDYALSYVQHFHNGIVEAVNSSLLTNRSGELTIAGLRLEEEIRKLVKGALPLLSKHEIETPLHIMLSLLHVKGYRIGVNRSERYPIDRDELIIPAAALESFESDIDQVLLPAFNRMWNAAGVPRSPNYDDDNKWKGRDN